MLTGLVTTTFTQALTFLPLALAISISYRILRATDMTLDGSFVLGAGLFARLYTSGLPPYVAGLAAIAAGGCAGLMTGLIQRDGRIDPLLAGILAGFILISGNLILMGQPNISLYAKNGSQNWLTIAGLCITFCTVTTLLIYSKFGLSLRALGDNPQLFKQLGKNIELYRCLGFGLTNSLAAIAGCLTAETIGYADIGLGLGMTLTGIGAIIIGQYFLQFVLRKEIFRAGLELTACFCGVIIYFFALNSLLRLDIDPLYLKMILGIVLILFLRGAGHSRNA